MSTRFAEIWNALAAPFAPGDVKQRSAGGGRQLSYITARTAMNRLDDVLGPENWDDRYYEVCEVLFCEITVRLPDGTTVSKSDAGGFKEMTTRDGGKIVTDEENTDKTGPSDAFKRAAAKFGVGRYLYGDGVPQHQNAEQTPARPQERPAPPPANGTHRHRLDPWEAEMQDALAEWGRIEGPPATEADFNARRGRIVNDLVSAALAAGRLQKADVAKPDKPDVRSSTRSRDAARRLFDADPAWVRLTISEHLERIGQERKGAR